MLRKRNSSVILGFYRPSLGGDNFSVFRKSASVENDRGAVLLEFGLILPFLVLFCLVGLVDTGGIVNKHLELNSLSKDAVRRLSKEPGIGSLKAVSNTCFELDITNTSHRPIHKSICQTLWLSGFDPKESVVQTEYVDFCPGSLPACVSEAVRVDISVKIKTNVLSAPYTLHASKISPRLVNGS